MSQPFTFPPPPPPPPKRSVQQQAFPQQNHRGTSRGRGGNFGGNFSQSGGRGRGQTHSRGGYNQHRGAFNHSSVQQRNEVTPRPYTQEQHLPQKRPYSNAFRGNAEQTLRQSRPRAPPAVPSFGTDINNLLSAKSEQTQPVKPNQPARKPANLLGLTPVTATEESDSESDVDDEIKLAAASTDPNILQFEHKGEIATLNTPEEIAAWVAERRKKWPTEEKREIARKQVEEQKAKYEAERATRLAAAKAKVLAREQERQKRNLEREKSAIRQKIVKEHIQKAKTAAQHTGPLSTAQLKIERLRKRAEKAANQIERAERSLTAKDDTELDDLIANVDEAAAVQDLAANINLCDISSSDEMEDTSSSGSSDSESGSDAAPEEMTSKSLESNQIKQPLRIPVKEDTRSPCKGFQSTGFCKFGRRCRFKHEKPVKEHVSKPGDRRKGLYQILVEKEQEEERKRALMTIIALGDAGLLDTPHSDHQDHL